MPKSLSPAERQVKFARRYISNGGNASEAAEFAGYGSAGVAGCRLLKNAKVQQIIKESQNKAAEQHDITVGEIIKNARAVIERSLQAVPVLDSKGEATGEYRYDSRGVVAANEQLAKIAGVYAPEKKSVSLTWEAVLELTE